MIIHLIILTFICSAAVISISAFVVEVYDDNALTNILLNNVDQDE